MKRLTTILSLTVTMLFAYFSTADQVSSKLTKDQNIIKVSDVMGLKEGSKVWMQGSIVRTIGEDHYKFKDDSGEIKLKISKSLLKGVNTSPDRTVKIYGKVGQNDYLSKKRNIPPEIEVKKIEILKDSDSKPGDSSLICVDTDRK